MARTKLVNRKVTSFDDEGRTTDEIVRDLKYISVTEAHRQLKEEGINKSIQIVRRWIPKYNLGRKIGDEWLIDRRKWKEFVYGENKTG